MITKRIFRHPIVYVISIVMLLTACHSGNSQLGQSDENDSIVTAANDTVTNYGNGSSDSNASNGQVAGKNNEAKANLPTVLIYNFHVTNRCASCIAIEDATTKTLNTYFANEVKQGRIKRQTLNVDDVANKTISEKYQAFGSGLFVTRVFKGKETTADLTGDGFKYAKNKEVRFIEILKNKITEYLK
jgi:hypothetical protein